MLATAEYFGVGIVITIGSPFVVRAVLTNHVSVCFSCMQVNSQFGGQQSQNPSVII
jgi:hypothetical protein